MLKSTLKVAGLCALALTSTVTLSHAGALNLGSIDKDHTSHIIKTHGYEQEYDLGEAFNSIAQYGYYRVSFQGRRDNSYGQPTYKFKACRNGLKYFVYVGWNGEILNTRAIGECNHYRSWISDSYCPKGDRDNRTPYW